MPDLEDAAMPDLEMDDDGARDPEDAAAGDGRESDAEEDAAKGLIDASGESDASTD
jgi:hypothetical protein